MHIMPQDNPTKNQSNEIPMPKLWRDHDLAMPKMQKVCETLQMPKMRICWTLGAFVGPYI